MIWERTSFEYLRVALPSAKQREEGYEQKVWLRDALACLSTGERGMREFWRGENRKYLVPHAGSHCSLPEKEGGERIFGGEKTGGGSSLFAGSSFIFDACLSLRHTARRKIILARGKRSPRPTKDL